MENNPPRIRNIDDVDNAVNSPVNSRGNLNRPTTSQESLSRDVSNVITSQDIYSRAINTRAVRRQHASRVRNHLLRRNSTQRRGMNEAVVMAELQRITEMLRHNWDSSVFRFEGPRLNAEDLEVAPIALESEEEDIQYLYDGSANDRQSSVPTVDLTTEDEPSETTVNDTLATPKRKKKNVGTKPRVQCSSCKKSLRLLVPKKRHLVFLRSCGHVVCNYCIYRHINSRLNCPICEEPTTYKDIKRVYTT